MPFYHPRRTGNSGFGYYVLTIAVAALAYLAGSLPLGFVYFSTGELGDPLVVLEKHFGLNVTFSLLVLPLVFSFFAVLASLKWIHRFPLLTVFTARPGFDFKRLFIAFGLWFSASTIIFILDWNNGIQWNFDASRFFVLLLLATVLLPLQCAVEEVVFRGVLFQWMGKSLRPVWMIAVVTGVLFGLMHGANPEVMAIGYAVFAYYIITGIFLGIIALIDDGIELTLGYHIANNFFVAIVVTNDWQAFQTDALFLDTNPPSFTLQTMVYLLIAQGVFFVACARLFKWKNIGKRLSGWDEN